MFAEFNNEYAVLIDKEYSLSDEYLNKEGLENLTNVLSKNNYCPGFIHSCSLKVTIHFCS